MGNFYTPSSPSIQVLTGATATFSAGRDTQNVSMIAGPNVGAVLTVVLPDVNDWDGDCYRLTNSGPYAPEGVVRFQFAAGNTVRGNPGLGGGNPNVLNLCGDETIDVWPDVPGTDNILFKSSRAGVRQVHRAKWDTQIQITGSSSPVSTGLTAGLSEPYQTLISREAGRFTGAFSTDSAQPRSVYFDVWDGASILGKQWYTHTDPNVMMAFEVEYALEGLRSAYTPNQVTLRANIFKFDGTPDGTLWIGRPATSAGTVARVRAHIDELPIA